MIALSPTSALMAYLLLTFSTLLILWLRTHYQQRSKEMIPPRTSLHVCEYCTTAYVDHAAKKITKCPTCQQLNRASL